MPRIVCCRFLSVVAVMGKVPEEDGHLSSYALSCPHECHVREFTDDVALL